MKRSFAELDSVKHESDRKDLLQKLLQEQKSMDKLSCYKCYEDIDQYYQSCAQLEYLERKLQVLDLLLERIFITSLYSCYSQCCYHFC